MPGIKYKFRERFETELKDVEFLDKLELLVGQVRCDINRIYQQIKIDTLHNPNAELKIGDCNEGFRVHTWLSDNLINLRGKYWDKLKYPSNPILYDACFNFIKGVRDLRKKGGEDDK